MVLGSGKLAVITGPLTDRFWMGDVDDSVANAERAKRIERNMMNCDE